MAKATEAAGSANQPAPLRISRVFAAPRGAVFKAWSSADHVKRWFCPTGYDVPEAKVDMRVGGAFEVCMRAPDGTRHWTRGVFTEVSPTTRLALDMRVEDAQGRGLFNVHTAVSFADAEGGARMEVTQTYAILDPAAARMTQGAPEGWAQTLDKLAVEIARMQTSGEASRSVVHATFQIERTYDARPDKVFAALSNEAAKSKWFAGADGQWELLERRMDFRVGGSECLRGRWTSGLVTSFDAVYHDIVAGERIVYTYEMHLDDRKISVSLATLQLTPAGAGKTTLTVTEQGAFLDGYDDAGSRERGTASLLDRLGESLRS